MAADPYAGATHGGCRLAARHDAPGTGLLATTALVLAVHLALLWPWVTGQDRPPPTPLQVRLAPPLATGPAEAAPPAAASRAADPATDRPETPVNRAPHAIDFDASDSTSRPHAHQETPRPHHPTPGPVPLAGAAEPPAEAPGVPVLRLPAPFVLRYAQAGQAPAHAELGFETDGQRYRAWLRLEPPDSPALIDQSEGAIGAEGLRPLRFVERRRGLAAAHFVWDQGIIRFSGQQPDAALPPGAQDRVSVWIQLAARLSQPDAQPVGSWSVWTASAREAAEQVWERLPRQTLQLPGGPVDTEPLRRLPRHPFEPVLESWHAPALMGLPVRLRLTRPGAAPLDLWLTHAP